MSTVDDFTALVLSKITEVNSAADQAGKDLENISQGFLNYGVFPAYPTTKPTISLLQQNIPFTAVAPAAMPSDLVPDIVPSAQNAPDYEAPGMDWDEGSDDPDTDYLDVIAASILNFTDSTSAATQAALFDSTRERDLQILDDSLLRVASADALSGFPLRTDMSMAARNELVKKYMDERETTSRQVTTLMADRAQTIALKGLDAKLSVAQIKLNLQQELKRTALALKGYFIEKYKAEIQAAVTVHEEAVRTLLANLENKKAVITANSSIRIENQRANVAKETTRIERDLAVSTEEHRANLQSNELNNSLMREQATIQIQEYLKEIDEGTQRAHYSIQQVIANNEIRMKAAQVHAEYYKGIIQSLAQMVNASLSKKPV